LLAYGATLLATLIWSLNPVIIRIGAGKASAIAFNGLRAFLALILLLPLTMAVKGGLHVELTPFAVLLIVLSALVGPGLGDVAYIRSIQLAGASRAVTVGYTYIFVSQALAVAFLGEEIRLGTALGSILAVAGVWLVASEAQQRGSSELRGVLVAIVSSLAWGLGSIINRLALVYTDPLSLSAIRAVIQGAVLSTLDAKNLKSMVSSKRIIATACITGVLAYGMGTTLFLYALSVLGVSMTVLPTALTPVLSTMLSRIIAHETFGLKTVVGVLCTASGIALALQL